MQDADIEPMLHDILREATGQPELRVEAGTVLHDIAGWDSVTMVSAILSIEDRFDIEFQRNEFAGVATVGDLAALVVAALVGAARTEAAGG